MYKAALLGRDIGYTKSPAVHAAIAKAIGEEIVFDVVDVPYDELDGTVRRLLSDHDGFYITKPYKHDVKPLIPSYKTECGVNFVDCKEGCGYNTDGIGFLRAMDLRLDGWRDNVKSALVLGAGGAAYAVCEALIKLGKEVYVLNRTMLNAAKLCKTVGAKIYLNQPAELVVNATSLGLNGEDAMATLCVLPEFKYAYDLIYSPPSTSFLRRNKMAGAVVANGADMLVFQAIEGDKLLTKRDYDVFDVFGKTMEILNGQGSAL